MLNNVRDFTHSYSKLDVATCDEDGRCAPTYSKYILYWRWRESKRLAQEDKYFLG